MENTLEKEVKTNEEDKVVEEPTLESNDEKVKVKKDKHKERIIALETEIANIKDQYLRANAEMENTKRRLKEESIKDRMYASQNLVSDLLNPIDMLLKVVSMETQSQEINNFLIGFKMISNQLLDVLLSDGLKEIEVLGKEFDPTISQAVEKVKVENTAPNMVIDVIQKGYMYKDRVLRPAMVKISD